MSSWPCNSNSNSTPFARPFSADGDENVYYTSPDALSTAPDSFLCLDYGSPDQYATGSYFGDMLSPVGWSFDGTYSSSPDALSSLESHETPPVAEPHCGPASSLALDRQQEQGARYPCICPEYFNTLEALEQHARLTRHRVYVCRMGNCRKSFYRRDSFCRHKSLHNASDNFLCSRCPRTFKRKDHLDQHIKNIHADSRSRRTQRKLDHVASSHSPRKQAVKDLRQACISRFPDDSDAVQKLQDCLHITDDSTSEEVAHSVVEMLLGSRGLCNRT